MNKEKISLEDNYSNQRLVLYQGDDSDNQEFEYTDEVPSGSDGEKGWTYYSVILRRKSDSKYFKFEKMHGSAGMRRTDFEGREVVPKEVKTTIYE